MSFALPLLLIAAMGTAQNVPTEANLPVRRVVLFKSGVGYFEHRGRVHDSQQVNVSFTSAQLNDVLKSLTVLDMGKGRITGVSYNSTAPLAQRLQALRLPLGGETTQAKFLSALRGARVEVRNGTAAVAGKLLSVESREVKRKDDSTTSVDTVSLVTEAGEVRSFELNPATAVRVLEPSLNEEIGRYLSLVASTREQDVRRMTIDTAGAGERELFVSYISEVPVWKSTYRIVLPEKANGKSILQGWAIVDNTVGEDWKDVQLSLVTGAPQSFVEPLSTPYYARRPVVALPQTAMLTPQTHERTLESEPAGSAEGASIGTGTGGGVGSGHGAGVGPGTGGGFGGGSYRVGGGVSAPRVVYAPELEHADDAHGQYQASLLAQSAASSTQAHDLGDLFEYKLDEPVTICKDQSALVPIVQARVDVEKVTLWPAADGKPLRALWLSNSSGLTLDGGSFNVLESGTFAGEGLMDPIKPGEKRLLSYAADLGVVVDTKRADSQPQRVTRAHIEHGVLTQLTEWREEQTYTVRNQDTAPRTMVIEHPVRNGFRFPSDSPQPVESTASAHRFRLTVEPKSTATLKVTEYHPLSVTYELTNLTGDQLAYFVQQRTVDAAIEKELRGILARKDALAAMEAQIQSRRQEVAAIFEDQQRVRENLTALKSSAEEKELIERYTRELNRQEDRVQALRAEADELQRQRDAAKAQLDTAIQELALDATL
jgi:hypothetical protein